MAITPYLAMTASEIHNARVLPPKLGWMACHFSPYSTGLTNQPTSLPPKSLLILNDRIPPMHNQPEQVAKDLMQIIDTLNCSALLLDFQCPGNQKTAAIASELIRLPYPVAVSIAYGKNLDCPLFLPPVPVGQSLENYLTPYKGRELWLELAQDASEFTITQEGSHRSPIQPPSNSGMHHSKELCCHYSITVCPDMAKFTLQRTRQDLADLLSQATELKVTQVVGLWQELN